MARTAIPIQDVPLLGDADVTWNNSDQANGMIYPNDGQTILLFKNGDASSHTPTVRSVTDDAGRTGDKAPTIAAGVTHIVGPLRPQWFNQRNADLGNVYLDFSAGTPTTFQVAAIRYHD